MRDCHDDRLVCGLSRDTTRTREWRVETAIWSPWPCTPSPSAWWQAVSGRRVILALGVVV